MNLTAERLRYERTRAKLLISELSKLTGISERSLTRYENEERPPNTECCKILASVYSISIDYLLGVSDDPCCNLTEEYRIKWYQYQQGLNTKIFANTQYYWMQFDPSTEAIPMRGIMEWCGRDETGNELYSLRSINPKECEKLVLSSYKENPLVVNSEEEYVDFLTRGKNAFVSENICQKFVPYLMRAGTVSSK